jgi:hypothetical protein
MVICARRGASRQRPGLLRLAQRRLCAGRGGAQRRFDKCTKPHQGGCMCSLPLRTGADLVTNLDLALAELLRRVG